MQSLDVVLSTLAIVLFVSPIAIALFLIGLDLPVAGKPCGGGRSGSS
jgi:hypothetical protein